MFEARPADNRNVNSRSFQAASAVVNVGKLTVSAASRGAKGIGALLFFFQAFVWGIGVLAAIASAKGLAQGLLGLALGCAIVGGLGYAGVRLMFAAIKG